jgi:hypothetical protein
LAKAKAKKHTKGRQFPWVWVVVVLFIAVLAFVFTSQRSQLTTPPILEGTRAAIIDQLYSNYPNEDFTTQITQDLEDYGFNVDIYQGDDITVDLFRDLPTHNYKLIIFRGHSGAVLSNPQELESIIGTYLFTNESFDRMKYTRERLKDELAPARVSQGYPYVFAIGSKFITNSMKGNLDNAVVIVDGCSCLYDDDLAQAFVDKGASSYLAWDATVDLDYVDEATISLIENLCSEQITITKAVSLTMAQRGPDPKYGAVLKYYPQETANKTLKQLIQPSSP